MQTTTTRASAGAAAPRPVALARGRAGAAAPAFAPSAARPQRPQMRGKATAELSTVAAAASTSEPASVGNFVPVCPPEELPKGVRKEARVQGKGVLLFWYRNQIYAIESRSPAEGAYSEGFAKARFTQDYGIECPSTGSVFSLRDGSILEWYPTNFVLKMLTPQSTCRAMEIYPVRLTQDAISVDVSGGANLGSATKGGSDTSLESNNIFSVEPATYVGGGAGGAAGAGGGGDAAAGVAVAAVGALAMGATVAVAYAVFKYVSQ